MLQTAYKNSSIDWKPSPVVALATCANGSQVAAARQDGSLEIWVVSPGSVGWHCQLSVHGDPNARVSSLVWCPARSNKVPSGRLLSSGIDGSISEWDLFNLKQKKLLENSGITIWQMALAPCTHPTSCGEIENGIVKDEDVEYDAKYSSASECDSDTEDTSFHSSSESTLIAFACDDGCVRLYEVSDFDDLVYRKSLPRVSGRMLSVTWSSDATMVFAGSSDGLIRCWNANVGQEIYRITAGPGDAGVGNDTCIWSLLFLKCGTLISADSTGSVQFWDSRYGTLLQSLSCHKGDVNALAAAPGHNKVFSAGSDGQVVLYKICNEEAECDPKIEKRRLTMKKWMYVNYVRAHTHDVRALAVAVPISSQDSSPEEKVKRMRKKRKPVEFSYRKWAHVGVPMLISGGDDTKIFAYSANDFTKFSPHDICPAPQRVPIQLVLNSELSGQCLLVQSPFCLDIFNVCVKNEVVSDTGPGPSRGHASTKLIARIKSKNSRKIICSCISGTGRLVAYSDDLKINLLELKKREVDRTWSINKRRLSCRLPYAHCMVFSSDSSSLMIAGHDKKLYIVDVGSDEVLHAFVPYRSKIEDGDSCNEPPITKMFTSHDGQWLAAINCFGDVYIFNLETQRQHWFIGRLDGASITAGGFPPQNNNVLVVTTSLNQVYAFDVEAKQLGDWSVRHASVLPQRFQEFPGEIIGLSFLPSLCHSPRVIVYSARAMCLIDFALCIDRDDVNGYHSPLKKKLQGADMNEGIKRRRNDHQTEAKYKRNFEFVAFRDPVLFIGNLSDSSVLIIDKPWLSVLTNLESAPLHRHIYGT